MSKHNKGNGIYFETKSTTGWILNKAFIPTGRIKRMRTKYVGSFVDYLTKPKRKKYADAFHRCNATITRWNRH